jgi:hypothetical protein
LGHVLRLLDPGDRFNVELDLEGLEKIATKKHKVREFVEEYTLGKAAEQRIPNNIRIRLKELYRSFILGNHLAAIALARAVLEYALVDRSAKIGINPLSDDPRYPNRTRKLGMLVEDASENRPELKLDMKSIVDAGNKTLHPKKKDNLVLLPDALRGLALTSIKAVRRVVENLYLEK